MRHYLTIKIDGEPAVKERPRFSSGKRKDGRPFVRVYSTQKQMAAEERIGWILKSKVKEVDSESMFGVLTTFHTIHDKDLDNMVKLILDAANGIIWKDDKQVVDIHARKQKNEPAHTELMIWTL